MASMSAFSRRPENAVNNSTKSISASDSIAGACDVLVVGAGPAGATAAIVLANRGHKVILLDRGGEAPQRIGESLPAAAKAIFRNIGLWDAFQAEPHVPCYGNRSVWGSETPYIIDSIKDPNGHGWHLDRARFDNFLRNEAVKRGAILITSARFESATPSLNHEYPWHVALSDGPSKTINCRLLIDATGRSAFVARALGAQRVEEDRVVSVYMTLKHGELSPDLDRDSFTLVEAVEKGWWYTALLPSGDRMLAFQTDADMPVVRNIRETDAFLTLARETTAIRHAIHGRIAGPNSTPRIVPANSIVCSPPAGSAWLAVGDAATSFDPISSQGILTALYTGMTGGKAAVAQLAGDSSPLRDYLKRIHTIYKSYRHNLRENYGLERRWNNSEFWRRRIGER